MDRKEILNQGKEASTNDLKCGLMQEANLESYLVQNQEAFSEQGIAQTLNEMYHNTKMSKAALARQAGMSEVYLHQVFSGRRMPSRDRLLCLCISMGADLEQTQQILRQAAYGYLYPRHRRDAIICHGIVHHTPLAEINDNLFSANEKTLF